MTEQHQVSPHRHLALFLLLLGCYSYFVQPPGANALSRYDLVRALVDDRSLAIDPYHQNTVDKGYLNGHYYSDKAFGLSLLAVPAYVGLRTAERIRGGGARDEQHTVYFLTLFAVALPSAALAVLIARAAMLLGASADAALLTALVHGLGTMAFPFATLFFGHQTASFAAFAAAYLLFSLRLKRLAPTSGRHRRAGGSEDLSPQEAETGGVSSPVALGAGDGGSGFGRSLAAGLLAGLAALVEYPVAIVGALLVGYLLVFFRDRRYVLAFLIGIAPAALALGSYNYLAFGEVSRVSYVFVNDTRFAEAHRGLMGVSWPDAVTALRLLFAGKGLLVNTPILMLAAVGLRRLWSARRTRPEALLCVAVAGSFWLYNAGYYMPFGGWTPGPRFLIPALPFLVLPLATVLTRSTGLRPLIGVLAAWSVLVMTIATATTPLVSDAKGFPLWDVWIPGLVRGDLVYNLGQWYFGLRGTASLLPLTAVLALGSLALGITAGSRAGRLRALRVPVGTVLVPTLGLLLLPLSTPLEQPAAIAAEPTFAVTETAPARLLVHPGEEQTVVVAVQNGPLAAAHNVALWLEVNDISGALVYEDWLYPLNFGPREERVLTFRWVLPSDEVAGEREVIARVLHWSWAYDLGHTPPAVRYRVLGDGR